MSRLNAAVSALFLGTAFGALSYYGPWTNVHGRGRFFTDLVINPMVGWLGNIGATAFFATFGVLLAALAVGGNLNTAD